jgi:hypothetical protein
VIGLAVLYDYDLQGDRYSENASLSDTVREYRELRDVDTRVVGAIDGAAAAGKLFV